MVVLTTCIDTRPHSSLLAGLGATPGSACELREYSSGYFELLLHILNPIPFLNPHINLIGLGSKAMSRGSRAQNSTSVARDPRAYKTVVMQALALSLERITEETAAHRAKTGSGYAEMSDEQRERWGGASPLDVAKPATSRYEVIGEASREEVDDSNVLTLLGAWSAFYRVPKVKFVW